MVEVRPATAADLDDVVRVMAVAFDDSPTNRWLVPAPASLEPMFRIHARFEHYSPGGIDLALVDGEPAGAAFWDPPGWRPSLVHQVRSVFAYSRLLGRRVVRGNTLVAAMARARPQGPLLYLAGIGAAVPGHGVGGALLQHRLEGESRPAYLEASSEAAIPLYERFGFRVIGEIRIPDGPVLWPMLRE